MKLLTKKIGEIEFDVEIALNSKVCILHYNGEPFFFEDVDLAQVLRSVNNSSSISEVCETIKGIWREEELLPILKSYALDEIDAEDFWKVLCEADEMTKRLIDATSRSLRASEPESAEWFRLRSIMYDRVIKSGVLDE